MNAIYKKPDEEYNEGKWTIDKKIPLSLIIAFTIQVGGFLWYISKLESRIDVLETNSKRYEEQTDIFKSRIDSALSDLPVIRYQIEQMNNNIQKLFGERK